MKLSAALLPIVTLLLGGATAAWADEVMLKLSQCPLPVQRTLVAESKGAHLETVFKESGEDSSVYSAMVTIGNNSYEIVTDAAGNLVEKRLDQEVIESEVAFAKAPAAVQKTLHEEAEGTAIETLDQTSEGDRSYYETGVVIAGHNYWLMVDQHGRLMEKRLGFEIEEHELNFDQAPAAVQKTIERVAKGAKIETLKRTTENAKSEFDAFVEIDGRNYAVRVGEDGTLIEKTMEIDVDEENVELSKTPGAVQQALRGEAHAAQIESVVKKTEGDQVIYGIRIEQGGRPYVIIVNSTGLLVSKWYDGE